MTDATVFNMRYLMGHCYLAKIFSSYTSVMSMRSIVDDIFISSVNEFS